jgi:hypothetical protein
MALAPAIKRIKRAFSDQRWMISINADRHISIWRGLKIELRIAVVAPVRNPHLISLVLVDVIVQNSKTGLPVNTLHHEDFRLLDNGHEVPVATFDSGAHYGTRPIALWFVVICNEKNNGPNGEFASGGFLASNKLDFAALIPLTVHLARYQ